MDTYDKILFEESGDGYTISSKNKTIEGELIIPSFFSNRIVTSIKRKGFEKCEYITSVIIYARLDTIAERAFAGCCSLKRIIVPSTVKEIKYAGICIFNYTSNLAPPQTCDVIFEENSQLEYVNEYGISHGNIRIFFCEQVNTTLNFNAYGIGIISVHSPHSFKFNGTLQSTYINYCYPRIYPEDEKSTKCTKDNLIEFNSFYTFLFFISYILINF